MANRRHEPVRTCVACRAEAGKRALVRIVRGADGAAVVDLTGRLPGRGAYLHPEPGCIEIARKRRHLERALSASIGPEVWSQISR
jgi:uncharacterized protein